MMYHDVLDILGRQLFLGTCEMVIKVAGLAWGAAGAWTKEHSPLAASGCSTAMFCRGAVFSNPHQSLTAMDPTDKVQLGLPGVVSHLPGVCHDAPLEFVPAYAISRKTLMTLPRFYKPGVSVSRKYVQLLVAQFRKAAWCLSDPRQLCPNLGFWRSVVKDSADSGFHQCQYADTCVLPSLCWRCF